RSSKARFDGQRSSGRTLMRMPLDGEFPTRRVLLSFRLRVQRLHGSSFRHSSNECGVPSWCIPLLGARSVEESRNATRTSSGVNGADDGRITTTTVFNPFLKLDHEGGARRGHCRGMEPDRRHREYPLQKRWPPTVVQAQCPSRRLAVAPRPSCPVG